MKRMFLKKGTTSIQEKSNKNLLWDDMTTCVCSTVIAGVCNSAVASVHYFAVLASDISSVLNSGVSEGEN